MPISFKEDHISQIPALLMLEKLGYTYLTPDEALALRGGNLANVLLEPVLRKQLAAINVVQVSSVRTTVFSEQNITAGIDALRNIPMDEGFMEASQTVYDLLTSGKTLEHLNMVCFIFISEINTLILGQVFNKVISLCSKSGKWKSYCKKYLCI